MLGMDVSGRQIVAGWAPISPFSHISPLDATQVDVGDHAVNLRYAFVAPIRA